MSRKVIVKRLSAVAKHITYKDLASPYFWFLRGSHIQIPRHEHRINGVVNHSNICIKETYNILKAIDHITALRFG